MAEPIRTPITNRTPITDESNIRRDENAVNQNPALNTNQNTVLNTNRNTRANEAVVPRDEHGVIETPLQAPNRMSIQDEGLTHRDENGIIQGPVSRSKGEILTVEHVNQRSDAAKARIAKETPVGVRPNDWQSLNKAIVTLTNRVESLENSGRVLESPVRK